MNQGNYQDNLYYYLAKNIAYFGLPLVDLAKKNHQT